MRTTLVAPIKNIHTLVRKEVINVVREVLSDPDAGLELTSDFVRRLQKSVRDKDKGRTTSLSEIFKQYGI